MKHLMKKHDIKLLVLLKMLFYSSDVLLVAVRENVFQ